MPTECHIYKSFETAKPHLKSLLRRIEPSIADSLPDKAGTCEQFIVACSGSGVPHGVLKWCDRCTRKKLGNVGATFLEETATWPKGRGYGKKLFDAFLKATSGDFWCICLDKDAERFWRYIAKQRGIKVQRIGTSWWGSAKLLFKRP